MGRTAWVVYPGQVTYPVLGSSFFRNVMYSYKRSRGILYMNYLKITHKTCLHTSPLTLHEFLGIEKTHLGKYYAYTNFSDQPMVSREKDAVLLC